MMTQAAQVRAQWATRWLFFSLGFGAGAWAVHVPTFKAHYGLSELSLSFVFLMAGLGALAPLAFAERLVKTLGVAWTTRLASTAFCAPLLIALWLPQTANAYPLLLLMTTLYGGGMSLFDVAINTEGLVLEQLAKHPLLSGFHGLWNVGGMLGAASVAGLLAMHIPAVWQVTGVAVGTWCLMQWQVGRMLKTHPDEPPTSTRTPTYWRHPRLRLLGMLLFLGFVAEGMVYDWSVLYMKQALGSPQAQAALGYSVFAATMACTRLGGDYLRQHLNDRKLLIGGGVLAALSMLVVLLAAHPLVALWGLALVGAGIALVVPVTYNLASATEGVNRTAAVATVSAIGSSGFLLAPPLVGAVAQATSLPLAMGLIVVCAALLAFGAGRL